MGARFEDLGWKVKQIGFPYLEAEGRADVVVEGAEVCLALAARRTSGAEGGLEPVVALTQCAVKIETLDLEVGEHGLSWVVNALAAVFTDYIRDYVAASLKDLVVDKSQELLEPLNVMLAASWGPLSRALSLPDVAALPPLDAVADDVEAVELVLRSPGSLGLELQEQKGGRIAVAGLVDGGQARAAAAQLGLKADDVRGALLAVVDGWDCASGDRSEVVRRVTHQSRPRALVVKLRPAVAARRKAAARAGVVEHELVAASDPGRPMEPLGLRLKTHRTVREACVVAGLARGDDDRPLAAERAGAPAGALLCAATGAPRLLRRDGATPKIVGGEVLAAAKAAAGSGAPFALTFAPPPDAVVAGPFGGHVEWRGGHWMVRGGLALLAVDGEALPPDADASQISERLSIASRATMRDVHRHAYLVDRFAAEETLDDDDDDDLAEA